MHARTSEDRLSVDLFILEEGLYPFNGHHQELLNEPSDIQPDGAGHAPEHPGLGCTLYVDALQHLKYVESPQYAFWCKNCLSV